MNEHPTDQLEQLELLNRERLEGWWDAIGQAPAYPTQSDTVVRLLRAMGYAADNDRLIQFVNDLLIPPVPRQAGKLAWNATSIVALACAMEARRLWQPFSKIHGHKFTLAEKLCQVAQHDGTEPFNDLAQFDIEGLLASAITVAHDPGAVQFVIEALRTKLKNEGIL